MTWAESATTGIERVRSSDLRRRVASQPPVEGFNAAGGLVGLEARHAQELDEQLAAVPRIVHDEDQRSHQTNVTRRAQGFRTSSKKARARGSFDWPSQNMACLRTAGLRFFRAVSMSSGTPSS